MRLNNNGDAVRSESHALRMRRASAPAPKQLSSIEPVQESSASTIPSHVVCLGREVCGELTQVETREFLVTNGKGGYASLTIASSLTRSYHGLLIAALRPPLDRTLLLTKLNEHVSYLGRQFHLATGRLREYTLRNSTAHRKSSCGAYTSGSDILKDAPRDIVSPGEIICPMGYLYLESFRLEGTVPVFTYAIADAILEKRVWLKQGQNTVYVSYYLRRASTAMELELRALVNHRNHHERTSASVPHFDYSASVIDDSACTVCVTFHTRSAQTTSLYMRVDHGRAELANKWITGFVLSEERSRGLPDTDDNLHVASFKIDLLPGARVTFVATAEKDVDISCNGEVELECQHEHERQLLENFERAKKCMLERRRIIRNQLYRALPHTQITNPTLLRSSMSHVKTLLKRIPKDFSDPVKQLVLAADQFIITRAGGNSVVAGFPWFTDWARDTMISLPGLTLVTGRFEIARSILLTFAKYVSQGMLPNRFPDDGSPPTDDEYNNADGTLWYFESIRAYFATTGDLSLLEELFPVLEDIVNHHVQGTRFGISQEADGLLCAGQEGLALTWMDAKADIVFTPRIGKPVELQALWFNALHNMASFANELGNPKQAQYYTDMADRTERSFRRRFWNSEKRYCYDVVDSGPDGKFQDDTLRPNQLIAASLNWSPLTTEQLHHVVETCAVQLVTSHAVRTLPTGCAEYCGVYKGDVNSRDSAYHQGTGWTWLLGPFILAHLRAFGDRERSREFLLPLLSSHLAVAGLGQISEIFEGDPPFRARGCIAQAWSVAEVLRAWAETEPDLP